MSSLTVRHPDEEQLLRYADGEMVSRDADRLRSHMAACWKCRSELDDIERTIGECVRYHEILSEDCFPSPPAPWCDIRRRFAEADATSGSTSFLGRIWEGMRAFRWAPAGAALVLCAVIGWQLRFTPTARAAELLQRAVRAADSRPPEPKRIEIRTRTRRITRTTPQLVAGTDPGARELEALFTAANYSWTDPLSAKSYAAWRDGLPEKRDEITRVEDSATPGRSFYRIRTTTDSGMLSEAGLKLRMSDLRALEGSLQFRDNQLVEMAEVPIEEATAPVVAAPAAPGHPAVRTLQPSNPASAVPVTPGEELKVLAALHRLRADLGEPIEVASADGRILVKGIGVDQSRQREIRKELESMPGVMVQFSNPADGVLPPSERSAYSASTNPDVARLQARMESYLGGRASYEQFGDRILDLTDTLMARAHALRRLAERFQPEAESQLTAGDRDVLIVLRKEHAAALVASAAEIEQKMRPVLGALGAPAAAQPASLTAASWQWATEELFRTARRAETLLAVLVGGAAGDTDPQQAPTFTMAALTQLRTQAEAYQKISKAAQ